jgi:hypothetical protein
VDLTRTDHHFEDPTMTALPDRAAQLLARLAGAGGSGISTLDVSFEDVSTLVAHGLAERRNGRVYVTVFGRSEVEARVPKVGARLQAVPPSGGMFRG